MSGGKSNGTWISGEAVAEGRSALENGGQHLQTAQGNITTKMKDAIFARALY